MRIQIARDGDQILTESDYRDIKDSGEIAHFVTSSPPLRKGLPMAKLMQLRNCQM